MPDMLPIILPVLYVFYRHLLKDKNEKEIKYVLNGPRSNKDARTCCDFRIDYASIVFFEDLSTSENNLLYKTLICYEGVRDTAETRNICTDCDARMNPASFANALTKRSAIFNLNPSIGLSSACNGEVVRLYNDFLKIYKNLDTKQLFIIFTLDLNYKYVFELQKDEKAVGRYFISRKKHELVSKSSSRSLFTDITDLKVVYAALNKINIKRSDDSYTPLVFAH